MTPEQRTVVQSFSRQRVLVIGDAILDEYVSGDADRLSPEAPVPVLHVQQVRPVLGGAANTAANLAALGARVRLVGLVGDDGVGRQLGELAAAAGIQFTPLQDGRRTLRKVRVVARHQQLVRLDYEDVRALEGPTEAELRRVAIESLIDADIIVLSDYAKGVLTRAICQTVIAEAHAQGKEVIVDPRPQHAGHYEDADFITPNWKEAQGLLGWPETKLTAERLYDVGTALAARLRTNALVTLGPGGMTLFPRHGGDSLSVPTVAREVFDVSGAGDTVVATLALARAAGATLEDAVHLANRAAGLVVAKLGTATISTGELLQTPRDEGRLVSRDALPGLVATLRARGKRIATLNGSFDLLHAGHLHILREAKAQGDVLIVGLNSDASVRTYKGPDRPIVPEAQRAEMLLALRFVDYVHIFPEAVPMPFLDAVRPDVHVNGSEYGEACIEAETVRGHGGRLHLVGRLPGLSSTDLRQRIAQEMPARAE